MSPTDNQAHPPSQNLNFLYQRHRSRVQEFQQLSRATNLGSYDVGSREAYGEKFARMYGNMPREL